MADAVRHINLILGERVYCHRKGELMPLDGPHLQEYCWSCPFWGGMAGGYGVECIYVDPNVNESEVTYTSPDDALNAAPDVPADLDTIAPDDGILARDARVALTKNEDQSQDVPDNVTTPPTRGQAQRGLPTQPVMASILASDDDNMTAAAQAELERILRGPLL